MRAEFEELGVTIFAAASDTAEHTAVVAEPLSFPVGCDVSRAEGDALGAWWEPRRGHIQPSEFILTGKGRVLASTYSNSPLGRMDPAETLSLIKFLSARKPAKG